MSTETTDTADTADQLEAGPAEQAPAESPTDDVLVEEVSIDGMCGVY